MENITFYEKKNLFLENERPRKPLAYVCRPELAYMSTSLHMQLVFQKPMKGEFFFGRNPTSSRSHYEPLFSHYIKPYMAHFQNTHKILRENLRFTSAIMNQSGSFSQNIPKPILSWLWPILVLIFDFWSLLIILVWLWIDLTEENSQNQAKRAFVLRYMF